MLLLNILLIMEEMNHLWPAGFPAWLQAGFFVLKNKFSYHRSLPERFSPFPELVSVPIADAPVFAHDALSLSGVPPEDLA